MSNQTKIGLLMGLGVILLVGIIVSDHLASHSQNAIQSSGPVLARIGEKNPTNQNDQIRLEFLGPAPTQPTAIALDRPNQSIPVLPPVLLGTDPIGSDAAPGVAEAHAPTGLSATPIPAPAIPVPDPVVAAKPAQRTYTIEKDDNLSKIAAKTLGSRNRWPEIRDANKALFDKSKTLKIGTVLIIPGQSAITSVLPAMTAALSDTGTAPAPAHVAQPAARTAAPAKTYTVARGDLLGTIAQKTLGSSHRVHDLVNANRNVLPNGDKTVLKTGMTLVIPAP